MNDRRTQVPASYDERCLLPIHVYDTATSRPVAVLLRIGTTPLGVEIRGHLRRLVRRIRAHWPDTGLVGRGDCHYGPLVRLFQRRLASLAPR